MKKYIEPELKITETNLMNTVMLSGSDGQGGDVVTPGDDAGNPNDPIWGDSKKRDDFDGLW